VSNWQLWSKQVDAIIRLELKRYWLGRRWLGTYLLVLAPVALLFMRLLVLSSRNGGFATPGMQTLNTIYAVLFQGFILRFAIFFSCMTIFSQMFRGEILEKTLHYYLLAPVRREVLALGKYMAGLVATMTMFGFCTIATYILMFLPSPSASEFFTSGAGIPNLARYLAVVMLGCLGYGAVFLLLGLFARNPIAPAVAFLGWEYSNFILPSVLQKISVVHYLQTLCPVPLPKSPFAVLTEPTSPFISIPGLLVFTACVLLLVGYKVRRAEITYSTD